MEWLNDWWPILAIAAVWLITKTRRHSATKRADVNKTALDAVVDRVVEKYGDEGEAVIIHAMDNLTGAKKKLFGAAVEVLSDELDEVELRKLPEKVGDPVDELDRLLNDAIDAETKKEKVKRALVKVGSVALKVVGSLL